MDHLNCSFVVSFIQLHENKIHTLDQQKKGVYIKIQYSNVIGAITLLNRSKIKIKTLMHQ